MRAHCIVTVLGLVVFAASTAAQQKREGETWALPFPKYAVPGSPGSPEAALSEATEIKRRQCLDSNGSEAFCTCIAEQLPVSVDFADYLRFEREPMSAPTNRFIDGQSGLEKMIAAQQFCQPLKK